MQAAPLPLSLPRYDSAEWRALRAEHLALHPFCEFCKPRFSLGFAVDHITPHRGDPILFFDAGNLQTLCQTHHNASKKFAESRGASGAATASGRFIDPNHPWGKSDRSSLREPDVIDGASRRVDKGGGGGQKC